MGWEGVGRFAGLKVRGWDQEGRRLPGELSINNYL
jgi:hypothetical protein